MFGVFMVTFEHTYFTPRSSVSIVNFELVIADWDVLALSNEFTQY